MVTFVAFTGTSATPTYPPVPSPCRACTVYPCTSDLTLSSRLSDGEYQEREMEVGAGISSIATPTGWPGAAGWREEHTIQYGLIEIKTKER